MTPVRAAACALLPEGKGVFLRCDRGNALYVSNAPARTGQRLDGADAGFHVREERGLAFLTPDDRWTGRLLEWASRYVQEDEAIRHIARASFGNTEEEDRALLMEGIKRLEMRGNAADYDKMVRQRAAVCLRRKQGGGTLAVCARLTEMMRGGWKDENPVDGTCLLCGGDRQGDAHCDRPVR